MSTDAGYELPCLKATVHAGEDIVSESRIFYLLDHLHHTTTGYDELPAWFLRLTAPVYAGIIARLINLSVAHTHIPTQWKTSIILPIPKIKQLQQLLLITDQSPSRRFFHVCSSALLPMPSFILPSTLHL